MGYSRPATDDGPGWRGSSHSATPVRTSSSDAHLQPMAFRGTFDYSLDAKNRLTVPAKFRAALADGVVLAKGVEPCVEVWRPSDYDACTATVLGGRNPCSPRGPRAQALLRRQRARHRARLGRPRRASRASCSSTPTLAQGRRRGRRGRPPRGLGPRRLGRAQRRARPSDIADAHRRALAILLDMTSLHVPVLAGELIEAARPAARADRHRLHGRRRRPRAPGRRAARPGRHADRRSTATRSPRSASPSSRPRSRATRASSARRSPRG